MQIEKTLIKELGHYTEVKRYSDPQLADVHIDTALTNLAVGYRNGNMIGQGLMPIVSVAKESDKYYVFGKENFKVPEDGTIRAVGADFKQWGGFKPTTGQYLCEQYGLEYLLDNRIRNNSDMPITVDKAVLMMMQDVLALDYEQRIASLLTTVANFDSTNYTTITDAANQWDAYTTVGGTDTSDPLEDIRKGIQAVEDNCGMSPNVIAMDKKVWRFLRKHPSIVAKLGLRINLGNAEAKPQEFVDMVDELSTILIAGSRYDTATEGDDVSLSATWGKDVVLAYVPGAPVILQPSIGYTFEVANSVKVYTYDHKGWATIIRVEQGIRDEKIVAKGCGYVIKAAIS